MNNSFSSQTPAVKKKSPGANPFVRIFSLLITVLFILFAAVIFSSGGKLTGRETPKETLSFNNSIDILSSSVNSETVSFVYSMPVTHILPWNEEPSPNPDPALFTENSYQDETIKVNYWTERMYGSNLHFAEVEIKHPSQLRTRFAGGEYNSSVRFIPLTIAQQANAVVATNADYYAYRSMGIIVRNNVIYRESLLGWDVLLIDDKGDFHIMTDRKAYKSKFIHNNKIVNSLHFGPSLVIDGKVNILNLDSGCGTKWNHIPSPRTAIGQIGELHYLMCVVEGRTANSKGVIVEELAETMLNHGCKQAYNLDGGQSTTMVFNDKAMNVPLWGGERTMSDIVYFATAIPDDK